MTDFNSKFRGYLVNIVEKDRETNGYAVLVDAEHRERFEEELATLSLNAQNRHQHLKSTLDNLQLPIGQLERNVHDLHDLLLNEAKEHQRLKSMLEELQMPIDRIERDLHDLRDDLDDANRVKILQWISSIPYEQHYKQASTDLMAGTGRWFLKDDELLEWRGSSTSSIMWLRGIAGSGKSKLM